MRLMISYFCFAAMLSFAAVKALSPIDYKVHGLEKFGSDDDIYSGHMPLYLEDNDEGSFFFYLAKMRKSSNNKSKRKNEKLIVWLNGGPGCTSLLGAFYENGPLTMKGFSNDSNVYDIEKNPFSWSEAANIVFVEQPIRTGFSQASNTAKKTRSELQIAKDFRAFMSTFLEVFSEFDDTAVYIAGESYAGFYVPWIADHILKEQRSNSMELTTPSGITRKFKHIRLEGAAVGNGAIDYMIQNPSYTTYAYNHGLIPLEAKRRIDISWRQCLDRTQYKNKALTKGSFDDCGIMEKVLDAAGHPNEYNTATFNSYDAILTPDGPFHTFMNDPEIQYMFHARGKLPGINFSPAPSTGSVDVKTGEFFPAKWAACNNEIERTMRRDHPVSSVPAMQYISKHIRLLLYSGEFDLNCNFLGTLNTLEDNMWDGRQWKEATRALYTLDGDGRGIHYSLGKLSFLVVKNSGHLLPMDQPVVALDMISRFLNDDSFDDLPLPGAEKYESIKIPSAFKSGDPVARDIVDPENEDNIFSSNHSLWSSVLLIIGGVFFGVVGSRFFPSVFGSQQQQQYSSIP